MLDPIEVDNTLPAHIWLSIHKLSLAVVFYRAFIDAAELSSIGNNVRWIGA